MESGQLVHHPSRQRNNQNGQIIGKFSHLPVRRVGPNSNRAAIRGDGEDVRGAPERGDGDPSRVRREGDILDRAGSVSPVEGVQVVDGGEGRAEGVGHDAEQVEIVPYKQFHVLNILQQMSCCYYIYRACRL